MTWPTDAEVSAAVLERAVAGAAIVPYVLQELDPAAGTSPTVAYVERVLPEKLNEAWTQFSEEDHAHLRDLLANLVSLERGPDAFGGTPSTTTTSGAASPKSRSSSRRARSP